MTFYLHGSNRLEALAGDLGAQLREPLGGPLEPETVVVQGRGMSIWLADRLCEALGVWATPMQYPRHFVEDVIDRVLGEGALGEPPVSEDLLAWAVQALLPDLLERPELGRVAEYLTAEGDEPADLRLLELAARIATVFDQYLTYRPDWIRDWERGDDGAVPEADRWQPILWRAISERLDRPHVARVEVDVLRRLGAPSIDARLPPRVSLFGISTMPPLFARVLAALSRHVEVHAFLFSPSPADWRRLDPRAERSHPRVSAAAPLLASLGLIGADFAAVLRGAARDVGAELVPVDRYVRPHGDTNLARLQRDLYDVVDPTSEARSPLGSDASVTIHSCHGPLREVEVLHDQLLALLTCGRDRVAPEEVLVLCPDLETYGPLIEAVFSREPSDPRFVPFHVSDRRGRQGAPVVDALLRLLSAAGGRATAEEIVDLLVLEPIHRRFELDVGEVDRIVEWVAACGVRWGRDAADRARHGLPADDDNTWRFGLRRLLLGYAMPGEGRIDYFGAVPFDEIEGDAAPIVGKLALFARTLFGWLEDLCEPRTVTEWTAFVGKLANELYAPDAAGARQIGRIQRAAESLAKAAEEAGFGGTIEVATVRRLLEQGIDAGAADRGFLAGGVTFCAFVPMRSIPFRVVCLLGMNDGAFPRSQRPLEVDLIRNGSTRRRAGDRSPRDDDRYLFLETLCAARERLIMTYTGQSIRDARERPPSVCASELLDHFCDRCDPPAGGSPEDDPERRRRVRRALTVRHRLQGFSPIYFEGGGAGAAAEGGGRGLFSFSTEYAEAARSVLRGNAAVVPFLSAPLEPVQPGPLRLQDLDRFFRSPPAFFLNRRLGVHLKQVEAGLRHREPLELDVLDEWQLGSALLEHVLAGVPFERSVRLLRGRGLLPHGVWGELVLEGIVPRCERIAEAIVQARGEAAMPALSVEVPVGGDRVVVGTVGGRWSGAIVEATYSTIRAKHELSTWLRHVATCAAGHEGESVLVGRRDSSRATVCRWRPVPQPRARVILTRLVDLFVEGGEAPLPFLPETSRAYHRHRADPLRALREARTAYGDPDGGAHARGDATRDPHPDRAFDRLLPPFDPVFERGGRDLAETRFASLAGEIFDPLDEWKDGSA